MPVRRSPFGPALVDASPARVLPLASALRQSLREGYSGPDLRADVLAGLVVGVVALPLSMALAIASGVPPQHGLYTAIVAGGADRAARRLAGPGLGADRGVRRHPGADVGALRPAAACCSPALMAGVLLVVMGLAGWAADRVRALSGHDRLHRRHRRRDRDAAAQGLPRPARSPATRSTTWTACGRSSSALPTRARLGRGHRPASRSRCCCCGRA